MGGVLKMETISQRRRVGSTRSKNSGILYHLKQWYVTVPAAILAVGLTWRHYRPDTTTTVELETPYHAPEVPGDQKTSDEGQKTQPVTQPETQPVEPDKTEKQPLQQPETAKPDKTEKDDKQTTQTGTQTVKQVQTVQPITPPVDEIGPLYTKITGKTDLADIEQAIPKDGDRIAVIGQRISQYISTQNLDDSVKSLALLQKEAPNEMGRRIHSDAANPIYQREVDLKFKAERTALYKRFDPKGKDTDLEKRLTASRGIQYAQALVDHAKAIGQEAKAIVEYEVGKDDKATKKVKKLKIVAKNVKGELQEYDGLTGNTITVVETAKGYQSEDRVENSATAAQVESAFSAMQELELDAFVRNYEGLGWRSGDAKRNLAMVIVADFGDYPLQVDASYRTKAEDSNVPGMEVNDGIARTNPGVGTTLSAWYFAHKALDSPGRLSFGNKKTFSGEENPDGVRDLVAERNTASETWEGVHYKGDEAANIGGGLMPEDNPMAKGLAGDPKKPNVWIMNPHAPPKAEK